MTIYPLAPGKYGAKKTVVDGITFDSKAEARRYRDLRLAEAAGEIVQLQVHPVYELLPAFTTRQGERVRALAYEADFVYTERDGRAVVEDVKGGKATQTEAWKIKRKLFLHRYPDVELRIVEA